METRSEKEEIILPYDILSVGELCDKIEFDYEAGNLKTIKYYKGDSLLLTLTFTYDASGNLIKIERG
jgi:hypothetical protein